MKTEELTDQLYYVDPYLAESQAVIVGVRTTSRPRILEIELNRTIFFPQGGGQPSDQGEIVTATGTLKVDLVRHSGDRIVHEGRATGTLTEGDQAQTSIKWPRRQKYMRVHSAGHLLHDVLSYIVEDLVPLRGSHGDKAALEYRGFVDPGLQGALSMRLEQEIAADLPIRTTETDLDELFAMGIPVPPNLPAKKALRMIQIGGYSPMPDGGVHVRSTREIGAVVIHNITNANGVAAIRYGVAGRVPE